MVYVLSDQASGLETVANLSHSFWRWRSISETRVALWNLHSLMAVSFPRAFRRFARLRSLHNPSRADLGIRIARAALRKCWALDKVWSWWPFSILFFLHTPHDLIPAQNLSILRKAKRIGKDWNTSSKNYLGLNDFSKQRGTFKLFVDVIFWPCSGFVSHLPIYRLTSKSITRNYWKCIITRTERRICDLEILGNSLAEFKDMVPTFAWLGPWADAELSSEMLRVFKLIDEGKFPGISISLLTHLCQKTLYRCNLALQRRYTSDEVYKNSTERVKHIRELERNPKLILDVRLYWKYMIRRGRTLLHMTKMRWIINCIF